MAVTDKDREEMKKTWAEILAMQIYQRLCDSRLYAEGKHKVGSSRLFNPTIYLFENFLYRNPVTGCIQNFFDEYFLGGIPYCTALSHQCRTFCTRFPITPRSLLHQVLAKF